MVLILSSKNCNVQMKKAFIALSTLFLFAACNSSSNNEEAMQIKIDLLQEKMDNTYKPGLGEFMTGIQLHHAKLWFAGINANWRLADFEINEIKEALDDIRQFNTDRPEIKSLDMINPAIDSMNNAIKRQDQASFRSGYMLLTNTCNNCHRATQHEFNIITVPSVPPVSNQQFKSNP